MFDSCFVSQLFLGKDTLSTKRGLNVDGSNELRLLPQKKSGASATKKAPFFLSSSKLEIVAASWNMVSGDGTWCTTRHQQILADANRRYITPPWLYRTPPDSTRLFRKENSLLCNIYTVDFEVCVKFGVGGFHLLYFHLTLINKTHYIMKKILFTLILLAALPWLWTPILPVKWPSNTMLKLKEANRNYFASGKGYCQALYQWD